MHIKKFYIKNYRAITQELEIDIEKQSLLPIIGVNECGKTTILNAIFAFDFSNDSLNEKGKHLQDIKNLYSTHSGESIISALVSISKDEINNFIKRTNQEMEKKENLKNGTTDSSKTNDSSIFNPSKKKILELSDTLKISRNLNTKIYYIENYSFGNKTYDHIFCKDIVLHLPYILYFDDFRDSMEEEVEIIKDEKGKYFGWLEIIETLFNRTDSNYSVFKLKEMEERERKSVLAQVGKKLNNTLTNEWRNFKLEDRENLSINVEYRTRKDSQQKEREFLTFDVIEIDKEENARYFFIRDRSKGFYWFFNFVMKLEFNPKENSNSRYKAIYLLDEPGSYLHASAQEKLCKKLVSLSESSSVIYCTHSHYLLNPEVIPLGNIRIANKDTQKNITLKSYYDSDKNQNNLQLAFQPLYDALHLRPFSLDMNFETIVLTEGVTDFFLFMMFNKEKKRTFLPCTGAASIKQFVSILLAWRKDFFVFWDMDQEGTKVFNECKEFFGDELTQQHFRQYSYPNKISKKVTLEDLIIGKDILTIKEHLNLDQNVKIKKVISHLYYSKNKESILKKISHETLENINHNLAQLIKK